MLYRFYTVRTRDQIISTNSYTMQHGGTYAELWVDPDLFLDTFSDKFSFQAAV